MNATFSQEHPILGLVILFSIMIAGYFLCSLDEEETL